MKYASVGERFSRSAPVVAPYAYASSVGAASTVDEDDGEMYAAMHGPRCVQLPRGGSEKDGGTEADESEDCLYLNVWRPADDDDGGGGVGPPETEHSTPLPTMVWIHGGSFVGGSGSDPYYDGTNLAGERDVVVVTINYRLGLFGFLAVPPEEDGGGGGGGGGGMNGIHDQINALRWVKKYISHFGGDPDNVTVFGESAGSISVCVLCVSPLAVGLFRRSIQQSGECVSGLMSPLTAEEGAKITRRILDRAGAASVSDLANATRFPPQDIAQYSHDDAYGRIPFTWPTIDGYVIAGSPKVLYQHGDNVVPIDMMMGSNSYDSVDAMSTPPQEFITTADNMDAVVRDIFSPPIADHVLRAYSPSRYGGNAVAAFAQIQGDYIFRCASREFARSVSNKIVGSAYLYNYAHLCRACDFAAADGLVAEAGIEDGAFASHASDVAMVFGNYIPGVEPTDADLALSDEIMDRWVNFARSGDPNTDDHGGWSPVPTDDDDGTTGAEEVRSAAAIPSFVLRSGGGAMADVGEKVEQCAALLFGGDGASSKDVTAGGGNVGTSSSTGAKATSAILLSVCLAALMVLAWRKRGANGARELRNAAERAPLHVQVS